MELTQQDLQEYYGIQHDKKITNWTSKWSNYVAIYKQGKWHIAPLKYWEANHYIPDFHSGLEIPGYTETNEHTFTPNEPDTTQQQQRENLAQLGLQVLDNPVWWYDILRQKRG